MAAPALPAAFVRERRASGAGDAPPTSPCANAASSSFARRRPLVLAPVYAVLRRLPATADGARRLGLVTDAQLCAAVLHAVEHPPASLRIVGVPEIAAPRLPATVPAPS